MNDLSGLASAMINMGEKVAPKPGEVMYGTVSGLSPMEIELDNKGGKLSEPFLVLSKLCKRFEITSVVHTHSYFDSDTGDNAGGSETRTTEQARQTTLIWPGLRVGERVILLSFSRGQRFYVDKLEKWDNEV